MVDHASNTPTGYIHHAMSRGLATSRTFLANIQRIEDNYSLATTTLHPYSLHNHTPTQRPNAPRTAHNQTPENTLTSPLQYMVHYLAAEGDAERGPARPKPRTLHGSKGNSNTLNARNRLQQHARRRAPPGRRASIPEHDTVTSPTIIQPTLPIISPFLQTTHPSHSAPPPTTHPTHSNPLEASQPHQGGSCIANHQGN
jgi:hypothetical protein